MTAGQMRDSGRGYTLTTTKSTITGAGHKTYSECGLFRFFRKTITEQKALLNKEEGSTGLLILECRQGPCTKAMTHFRYEGKLYRIDSKIPDTEHHTYNITAKLVNE